MGLRCKKIHGQHQFRLMKKMKGAHLKRPQMHFGCIFDKPSEYLSLSDTDVIELRDWLSRYINEYINPVPQGEVVRASRVHAQQIVKNMNKVEAHLDGAKLKAGGG